MSVIKDISSKRWVYLFQKETFLAQNKFKVQHNRELSCVKLVLSSYASFHYQELKVLNIIRGYTLKSPSKNFPINY